MTTAWTLTAQEVIEGALDICGLRDPGEPISGTDADSCLRVLDGILKEMPLHGLSWPQLTSATVAVTWSAGTPSVVSPPADFIGVPVLKFTTPSGVLKELTQLPKPDYEALDTARTATYPESFFLAPSGAFYLWPVPTQDPVLKLTYQVIVADSDLTAQPGVKQAFLLGLHYWLADELGLPFGVPAQTRAEIAMRAKAKRDAMLQWASDLAPISFSVTE